MGLLTDNHVEVVSHYTPLHYLPFVIRTGALMSKPALRRAGFGDAHFRSKSKAHDTKRGFERYAFLTLDASPRIVKAKLAGGFPHIAIIVPASAIESQTFDLCRFNVAMTRRLRRDGKEGWPESDTNGRYYNGKQVPIARRNSDKIAMLGEHLNQTMIEVLVNDHLALPNDTRIVAYHQDDFAIVNRVIRETGSPWHTDLVRAPGPYPRKDAHARSVVEFIDRALHEPDWRGNGLEFDRV